MGQRWPEDYSGYVYRFLKARPQESGSELRNTPAGRAWLWRAASGSGAITSQVVLATVLINVLSLVGSLCVMKMCTTGLCPTKPTRRRWALSIGVVLANLFRKLPARMGVRG